MLNEKKVIPTVADIKELLGPSYNLWQAICSELDACYGTIEHIWKFYGKKNGWLLKSELSGRNLFFFIPKEQAFSLTFTFGESAVVTIASSELPSDLIEKVLAAKKYTEGRVVQLDVANQADVHLVSRLVEIKVAN